ncbi:MAG: LysR family transcriptional regulator [Novosphingobium sp.]|nr:LysR family transcriptional regulator [Novosphingobium sp.]
MDRLMTMEMFAAVAERGGFAAAARSLRVSAPSVTRGVAELEARLGVSLFHRSTRAVSLTEDGAALLPRARRILADFAATERELQGATGEVRGQLNITAPVLFGRLHVLPVVTELLEQHLQLTIELMLIDRNVRIVEEGIDFAVRIGALADSSLRAVKIGEVRPMLVASPAYIEQHGAPLGPRDLADHRIIASTGPRGPGEWQFGAGKVPGPLRPRLLVNSVEAGLAAAEAGVGIANLLSYQADRALREGTLVELFRPDGFDAMPVSLLFAAGRSAAAAPRAFIEAMRERAKTAAWVQ